MAHCYTLLLGRYSKFKVQSIIINSASFAACTNPVQSTCTLIVTKWHPCIINLATECARKKCIRLFEGMVIPCCIARSLPYIKWR